MDEFWVRCDPYEQAVSPGEKTRIECVVLNHLSEPLEVHLRIVPPRGWMVDRLPSAAASWKDWPHISIPARDEVRLPLEITVPASISSGRFILTVDVAVSGESPFPRILCGFTEAVIAVQT